MCSTLPNLWSKSTLSFFSIPSPGLKTIAWIRGSLSLPPDYSICITLLGQVIVGINVFCL